MPIRLNIKIQRRLKLFLLSFFLLSFALIHSSCGQEKQVGNVAIQGDTSTAIFNGQVVLPSDDLAKHTVMIVIQTKDSLMSCSGSLISPTLVITAAHCFLDENNRRFAPAEVRVLFGTKFDLKEWGVLERGMPIKNNEIVVAKYDPNTYAGLDNDLALLKLPKPAPPGYAAAKIITRTGREFWKAEHILAGFGNTDSEHESMSLKPFVLRTMKTTLFSAQPLRMKNLVLVSTSAERSPYKGDSGGPALMRISGKLYLWGVSSHATVEMFHSYTAIFKHLEWLKSSAAKLGSTLNTPSEIGNP